MAGVTPVRITATLATNPILPPFPWPLMLDGILAHRLAQAVLGRAFGQGELTEEDAEWSDQLPLPLAKHEDGGVWWWACSKAMTPHYGVVVEWQHSRNDANLHDRRTPPDREKIDETRARWKPNRLPRLATATDRLVWLAETTDMEALGRTLTHVSSVGKNWSRGSGHVTRWDVDLADQIEWQPSLRPMPAADGAMLHPLRPPYWMVNRAVPVGGA